MNVPRRIAQRHSRLHPQQSGEVLLQLQHQREVVRFKRWVTIKNVVDAKRTCSLDDSFTVMDITLKQPRPTVIGLVDQAIVLFQQTRVYLDKNVKKCAERTRDADTSHITEVQSVTFISWKLVPYNQLVLLQLHFTYRHRTVANSNISNFKFKTGFVFARLFDSFINTLFTVN